MRPVVSLFFRKSSIASLPPKPHSHTTAARLLLSLLGILVILFIPLHVRGILSGTPISLATIGTAYTQDFNTLANTGTSSTTPTGWGFSESGSSADATYGTGTGSSTTGNTYSFGAASNTERAFGGLRSSSLIPTIGACFTNNTGQPITKLELAYTGEQWRLGATGRADRLDFQYSTDATSLTTGTWINVDALDFSSPVTTGSTGALDGNAAANRTAINHTITGLNIPNGATFFMRWTDPDATGSDDGLAVDDFSLTPQTTPPPPLITTHPMTQTACAGQMVSFSVVATGIAPLGYQWRKNGVNIGGANGSTFTIAAAATSDDADYDVIVSDANGDTTSNPAHLTVNTAPTITANPSDQLIAPGAAVSFTAAATSVLPFTVQWQVSTDGGGTWSNVTGATTTTLTLPAVVLADNGKRFRAQFTNGCGTTITMSALLTVLFAEAKILDPLVCVGDGTTLNVRAEIRNTSNVTVAGVFRARLDAGLVTRNSSCVITGNGNCTFTGDDRVRWGGTLTPNEAVVIEYQVQVVPPAATGAEMCITSTFEFNAGPVATVRACTRVNCPMVPTGGVAPVGIAASEHKPGSVLFYNYYTSDVARPHLENTRFSITNTDGARTVAVHLFFVSADDCRAADTFLCLTANQTTSFLASEYDPGMQGYLVAVAVDMRSGCPINFNYLIGSEFVKLQSGHATSLGAIAIAALPGGPMACEPTDTTARLDFDGTDYNLMPRALAVNNIQSAMDGNNTLLILNRIGGNLTNTATRLGDLLGLVYDDKEKGYSFSFDPSGCQYVQRIFDGAPRIAPPLTKVIPSGHSGWMRLQHVTDAAMIGAVINFNPTGFSHGHNLHALTYTDASITIPVIPPVCGQ